MKFSASCLFVVFAGLSAAQWDNNSTAPIELAPAPWTLKGTVYSITLVPLSDDLPNKAFPPLERQYASATEGEYLGILGMIQIIRYSESPVGPYDELLIVPGFFKYNHTNAEGEREEKKNVRVSRIYVSQKYTCWNGRTSMFQLVAPVAYTQSEQITNESQTGTSQSIWLVLTGLRRRMVKPRSKSSRMIPRAI